jgi:uncharacterized protein
MAGCNDLGVLYDEGKGVAKDPAKAVEYFKLACEHKETKACANLGWHFVKGIGTTKNETEGMELLRRACSRHDAWACDKLKSLEGTKPSGTGKT